MDSPLFWQVLDDLIRLKKNQNEWILYQKTNLEDVHNKVENEQKAGGKYKPVQKQSFDYAEWVCCGHPQLHQLVKEMAYWSCDKESAEDKIKFNYQHKQKDVEDFEFLAKGLCVRGNWGLKR